MKKRLRKKLRKEEYASPFFGIIHREQPHNEQPFDAAAFRQALADFSKAHIMVNIPSPSEPAPWARWVGFPARTAKQRRRLRDAVFADMYGIIQ